MFAQVNQTEVMKEFLEAVLSPLQQWHRSSQLQISQEPETPPVPRKPQEPIRVFVSYVHKDQKYLSNDSLLGYLRGLEQEGFEFWYDQKILAGEIWDEEIRQKMELADITLVLVSQAFLNSRYCRESEIASFIRERKSRGLVIVPIILSACNWKGYDWLRETQFLPRDGKNKEEEKRAFLSQAASKEYADSIHQKTDRYFTEQMPQYVLMIAQHLMTFAQSYITAVLLALTLGFGVTELVDDLDEKQALELAKRIQADLEKDVRHHIGLSVWAYEKELSRTGREIAASLDRKEVRRLTERLIRKAGWDILRPFVEKTVLDTFTQQFEDQAKESFPYWIQLASAREVTRSLANLKTVLPGINEDQVYTDDIMFGATPFKLALEKAAIRLIDPQHREKKKVLLIISDGEFEDMPSSLITVDLLKRRGVVIATGVVGNKNVLSQLVKRLVRTHSPGTNLMFEIASQASDFKEEGI